MSIGFSSNDSEVDLESLRRRLRKMNDQELRRFEDAAEFMCTPGANQGQAPRQVFVIQLEEARAEQERRKTAEKPCKDKISYGSEAEANFVASYPGTATGHAALRAAKCPDCGRWHLTKQV